MVGGFLAFAPELAASNLDYRDESVRLLDSIQDKSFWFRARNRLIIDLARRYAPQSKNLLEIGCGSGYVLGALREAFPFAQLVGSELNPSGLQYTRKRVDNDVTLVQMDARHIPYAAEFDIVGAFDVIEHINEDADVIHEMWRATKPGGFVLLTVPQHPFLWSMADEYACHKRRYTTRELASKIRAAGLELMLDTSFVTSLFPAMFVQRLIKGRRKGYDFKSEFDLPRWIDGVFETLLDSERRLIAAGVRLPFGGSRVVVARRPASQDVSRV